MLGSSEEGSMRADFSSLMEKEKFSPSDKRNIVITEKSL